jgi:hypothetical protein
MISILRPFAAHAKYCDNTNLGVRTLFQFVTIVRLTYKMARNSFAAVLRTFAPASGALFEKSLTKILALPHGSQGMDQTFLNMST